MKIHAFRVFSCTYGGHISSSWSELKGRIGLSKGAVQNKEGKIWLRSALHAIEWRMVHFWIMKGSLSRLESALVCFFPQSLHFTTEFCRIVEYWTRLNMMSSYIKPCVTHTNSSRKLRQVWTMISRHQTVTLQTFPKYAKWSVCDYD